MSDLLKKGNDVKPASINPLPPANFVPAISPTNELKPFRVWCQKVLPLVYGDELSYYELLCKTVDYLNTTMENVDIMEGDFVKLHAAFVQLQNYVNNYFSSLDVQQEINNKLDAMVQDGTMTNLINPLIPPAVSDWLQNNLTPTSPPIDKSLTVDNAAANSKTVGDRGFLTDGAVLSHEAMVEKYGGSYDNLPENRIILIGSESVNGVNEPVNNFVGIVYTMSYTNQLKPGNYQVAVSMRDRAIYVRTYVHNEGWAAWEKTVNVNLLEDMAITTGGIFTTTEQFQNAFQGNVDNLTPNKVICLGSGAIQAENKPSPKFVGNIMTVCYKNTLRPGDYQMAVSSGNYIYTRYYAVDGWGSWRQYADKDRSLTAWGAILDNAAMVSNFQGSYDNLPINQIVLIGADNVNGVNEPVANFVGIVYTLSYTTEEKPGNYQVAVAMRTSEVYVRAFINNVGWSEWKRGVNVDSLEDMAITTGGIFTTTQQFQDAFQGDVDNLTPNKIVCMGSGGIQAENKPYSDFVGNIVTICYNEILKPGDCQMAYDRNKGIYFRQYVFKSTGNYFTPWVSIYGEAEYHVGETREHTSLIALFKELNDKDVRLPKVIYVDGGTYDIFQEYLDAGVAVPPDNVSVSNYFNYNVFVPRNTRVVGLGQVDLVWNPDASMLTAAQSKTWCPINIRYGCELENINIYVKNGRYCIHDDSHNAANDQEVRHVFKNVHAKYEKSSTDGYGLNNVTGFGFSEKNIYLFENCTFEMVGKGNGCLYGHGTSSKTADKKNSPTITIKDCVFIAASGRDAIRLQNLTTALLDIRTTISGCKVIGNLKLDCYPTSNVQGFNVEMLNSGNPNVVYNGVGENKYPVVVYNAWE